MNKLVGLLSVFLVALGASIALRVLSQTKWVQQVVVKSSETQNNRSNQFYQLTGSQNLQTDDLDFQVFQKGQSSDGSSDHALELALSKENPKNIFFRSGVYLFKNDVLLPSAVKLFGETPATTELRFAPGKGIKVVASPHPTNPSEDASVGAIESLRLTSSRMGTESDPLRSSAVTLDINQNSFRINNIQVKGFGLGISADSFEKLSIEDTRIEDCDFAAVVVNNPAPESDFVMRKSVLAFSPPRAERSDAKVVIGLHVKAASKIRLQSVDFIGGDYGFRFEPEAHGTTTQLLEVSETEFRRQSRSGLVALMGQNQVKEVVIKNASILQASEDGVVIQGVPSEGLEWDGGTVELNGHNGIRIVRASQVGLKNLRVLQNSRSTRNSYHGISVSPHCSHINIQDSRIENLSSKDAGQLYGLYIAGINNHSIHLEGNQWAKNGSPCPFVTGCSTFLGEGIVAVTGVGNTPDYVLSSSTRGPASTRISVGPKESPQAFQ